MWDAVLVFAVLVALGGAWAGVRGVRSLARGLRDADDPEAPLRIVRGLRGIIVAVCGAALLAGALFEQVWLLVFGALWLAEEIYETGVLALILRADRRPETLEPPRRTAARLGLVRPRP
jgi:hypothetical protein